MATTRIMPLHIGKGRTESQAVSDIIDYVSNPQKTDNGRLVTGFACDSRVAVPFPKKQTQKKLRKPNEAKEINRPAQSGKQNAREPATPKQSGDANDYKKPQCTQKCRPEPELGKQNAAGE